MRCPASTDQERSWLAASLQTLGQLERFAHRNPVFTLDLARAFADDDVIGDAITFARRSIADGSPFAISTAAPQADVEALQARFGRDATAARAEAFLSAIAKRIVFDLGVRRLIVAGGETSGAVASALGLTELSIGPYEGPGLNRALASSPAPTGPHVQVWEARRRTYLRAALDAMTRSLSTPPATEWPPARSQPEMQRN